MGLFSAIKNVLFEEETVELPVVDGKTEEIRTVREEPKIIKRTIDEEKEEIKEEIPDHDLYKSEKTFDFPMFDEEEFDASNRLDDDFDPFIDENPKGIGINLFDHEKPKDLRNEVKTSPIKGRAYDEKSTQSIRDRKFQPSPVISPVYGVLDKNYHKEDIVVAGKEKKSINVDDVRKKAFGKMKDDIMNTMDDIPVFDDTDELEIPKKEEDSTKKLKTAATEVFDDDDDTDEILVVNEKPEVVEDKKDSNVSDETLENDLFDLIDSMYEDKEEIE